MPRELINKALRLEEDIRMRQREVREVKGLILKEVVQAFGPEEAVASGSVTVNLGRCRQIFR